MSYPAPPAAPTVAHASPVPKYPRHQGGSFVPPCRGVFDGIPLPPAGPAAGSRSAARETRTPRASLSRAASLRLALVDLSTASTCALRWDSAYRRSRSNPRSPFDGRMSSPDQDPRGVKAGGRRASFRSTTRGRMRGGASTVLRPSRATGRSLDRPSGARRPVSQHPGEGCGERETTPSRATCLGYPARRPGEPSGSLPNRRPSRDPPRAPGSRRSFRTMRRARPDLSPARPQYDRTPPTFARCRRTRAGVDGGDVERAVPRLTIEVDTNTTDEISAGGPGPDKPRTASTTC